MVRTVAGGCTRASGGKAPSTCKQTGQSTTTSSSDSSSNSSGGGNTMKIWPTPPWQKGVESFFPKIDSNSQNNNNTSNATSTSVKPEVSTSESASSSAASSMEQPGVSTKELEIESQ